MVLLLSSICFEQGFPLDETVVRIDHNKRGDLVVKLPIRHVSSAYSEACDAR